MEDVNTVGSVIVSTAVTVHKFASVIVQVYVPAGSEVVVAPVPPLGPHA